MRVTYSDIKGVVGIVPTPATAEAADWRAQSTVALPETKKMVDAIISAGIPILMTTGTFGECATLTEQELGEFVQCVTNTVANRVPVFAGITTLNTRDTIRRGHDLIDIGADGLFIGRPMWLPLDDDAIVRYYHDIAEALPEVPLVVYDNPTPFKGKITTDVYKKLADIPEVVCAKHVGGPSLGQDIEAVGDRIRLLPLESEWFNPARQWPDRVLASWSGNVGCAPQCISMLSRAVMARDWSSAEAITTDIKWALEPMMSCGFARFMDYSIQIGHGRFRGAGIFDPGPTRPPYDQAPRDLVENGELTGRRFAELERKYVKASLAAE